MLDLLQNLCAVPGVSGDESLVATRIIGEIKDYADYSIDRLGNILVFKKGARRSEHRLMLCAHMDEVGLIVTYVTDKGLLKFDTVGGIDPRVLLGRRILLSKNGISGVIATKAVHLQSADERKTAPGIEKLYIDIGTTSHEETVKYAVPGDTAVFDSDYTEFGDAFIKARAIDDRIGCAMLIRLIQSDLPFDCYFAFTVQEEVGLRGAKTAAFAIKPDIAVVLEATTAADIPFVEDFQKVCFLKKGPVISFMDNRTIYDRELVSLALHTADDKKIKCQLKQAVAGGNDAGSVQLANGGVRTVAISLPCRYLHSPGCVIAREDAFDAFRLVKEFINAVAAL